MFGTKKKIARLEKDIERLEAAITKDREERSRERLRTLEEITSVYALLLQVQKASAENGQADRELLLLIEETRNLLDALKGKIDDELLSMRQSDELLGDTEERKKKDKPLTLAEVMDEYLNGGKDGREGNN